MKIEKMVDMVAASIGAIVLISVISGAQAQTCDLSANDISFGSLSQNEISGDVVSTLTNNGDLAITSISVNGTDWDANSGFLVSQTHFSLLSGQPYGTMTSLSTQPQGLSLTGFLEQLANLPVYFKLQVPSHQAAGDYHQTITFTFDCAEITTTTTTTTGD